MAPDDAEAEDEAVTFGVEVKLHAREQARARFPGFKTARIVDEVREAIGAGRLSSRKPDGIRGPDDPIGLYCWTAGGERVYALHHTEDRFVVMTAMRAS